MSYDYGLFLQAVRERRRPATATSRGLSPTGCFYCDHVLHTVCGPGSAQALRRLCEQRSGGLLDAHHLIPKGALKREFPEGVIRVREAVHEVAGLVLGEPRWLRYDARLPLVPPGGDPAKWREHTRPLDDLLMDPRNGVLVRRYHHDALEARALVIPKALLPADALEFAVELGLDWYVDKMQRRT